MQQHDVTVHVIVASLSCRLAGELELLGVLPPDVGPHDPDLLTHSDVLAVLTLALLTDLQDCFVDEADQYAAGKVSSQLVEVLDVAYSMVSFRKTWALHVIGLHVGTIKRTVRDTRLDLPSYSKRP